MPAADDNESETKDADVMMADDDDDDDDDEAPNASEEMQGASTSTSNVKLDDLFKDDEDEDEDEDKGDDDLDEGFDEDEDEEFPSSFAATVHQPPPSHVVDSNIMYSFYQRLFPFRHLFQWLNHGVVPSPDFANREFAFTLQNDAYLRYQSFPSADLLRKEILRLNPSRFEIGPVYSTNPRDRKSLRGSGAFRPVSKELVFDIDLTDYDDVRTCCTKASICPRCWAFVTMAIRVVDAALRDDFGFRHVLWVYSGRRGAHAWVCDRRARDLSDDRRRAIAGYLEVVRGGAQSGKRVNLRRPLHPHVARSLDILKPYFASTVLDAQDVFGSASGSEPNETNSSTNGSNSANMTHAERLLTLLPDKTLTAALQKKWAASPSRASASKWADIDTLARTSASRTLDPKALRDAKQDVVLEYTYPRLDAEVSKKQIHLLKSPFVVHPGTGRVCVPIDVGRLDEFDPLSVPRVAELLDQINQWDAAQQQQQQQQQAQDVARGADANGDADASHANTSGEQRPQQQSRTKSGRVVQDYEKTSLKPYVEYFRRFVAGLNGTERDGKRDRSDENDQYPQRQQKGVSSDAMEF